MPSAAIPDRPVTSARHARLAVLGHEDDDFATALIDAFTHTGRHVQRLDPESLSAVAQEFHESLDVIFMTLPWAILNECLPGMAAPALSEVVVVVCTAALVPDEQGFFMADIDGGSVTRFVAGALRQSRVVGAFNQFAAEHIALAGLGTLESDVPVIGDDREATDLVEELIDELTGFESVYAGGLQTAEVVEGLAAIVHQVGLQRHHPVGFRLNNIHAGGLRILD